MVKVCKGCGETKPLADFYVQEGNRDGRFGKCKKCTKERVIARARTNPAVQAYDRERAKLPHRRAHARAVADRWRQENPEAYRALTAVGNAIRDGRLQKGGRCESDGCERTDVHAHHDDYGRPLAVRWFCPLHNLRLRADQKRGASP